MPPVLIVSGAPDSFELFYSEGGMEICDSLCQVIVSVKAYRTLNVDVVCRWLLKPHPTILSKGSEKDQTTHTQAELRNPIATGTLTISSDSLTTAVCF